MNPIICAIDTTDMAAAKKLASGLQGEVAAVKLGLEFFTANGASGVREIASPDAPVFLDLKFHDIPNTVAGAVRSTRNIDCFMLTVHTVGGYAMMQAAATAAKEIAIASGRPKALVVGVTVLTSLDQEDLASIGVQGAVVDQAKRLADLAAKAGLDGVVCSPHEIRALRQAMGGDFTLVVPGIRPAGSASDDQKRVMTPQEALSEGATYLVIGRPITEAKDPLAATKAINASL